MAPMLDGTVGFVAATLAAITLGTFAEYFVHRAMHWGWLYPEGHRWHHASNDPRTFLHDVFDYGMGAAALSWLGFLVSPAAGFGWMLGALAYTLLASYAHQLQHANPDLVFWMKRPVHRLHHDAGALEANFGILVDWWDRLFGSYVPIERPIAMPARGERLKAYLAIPWR
jgi:sterol desaturase/sphingolipid hydroxylase (fatty acid hydroxylase superfamily)